MKQQQSATNAGDATYSEKVQQSRAAIEAFLTHQRTWLHRAAAAEKDGYFLETIGICQHQMHALLRRGLWLRSQNHALEQQQAWNDSYLFHLLLQSTHDMMESAKDQELYNAAMRFHVIKEEDARRLHALHEASALTLRELFAYTKNPKKRSTAKEIANEYLEENRRCLTDLEKEFAEFDRRIDGLIKKIEQ